MHLSFGISQELHKFVHLTQHKERSHGNQNTCSFVRHTISYNYNAWVAGYAA